MWPNKIICLFPIKCVQTCLTTSILMFDVKKERKTEKKEKLVMEISGWEKIHNPGEMYILAIT